MRAGCRLHALRYLVIQIEIVAIRWSRPQFMLDLRQFLTTATLPSKQSQALNLTVVALSLMHFSTDQHINYCSGSPVFVEGPEEYSTSSTLDLRSMLNPRKEIRDGLIAETKAFNL